MILSFGRRERSHDATEKKGSSKPLASLGRDEVFRPLPSYSRGPEPSLLCVSPRRAHKQTTPLGEDSDTENVSYETEQPQLRF